MTSDVRSLGGEVPTDFDFESQSGILFLLRAVRAASVSDVDKNKLKDLIFLYNTGGKDETVKNNLRELLATLEITPSTAEIVAKATTPEPGDLVKTKTETIAVDPQSGHFPSGRLVPEFGSTLTSNHVIAPADTASDKVVVKTLEVPNPVISSPVNPPVIKMTTKPVVTVPRPNTVTEIKPMSAPTLDNVFVPESRQTEPEPRINETVTSIPTSTPVVSSETGVLEARMERIRTIKSDINGRIGNPVNLVDVDNSLGREYMGALLDAMKLLGSAPEADSNKAMLRLETVYQQVLQLINNTTPKPEVVSTTLPIDTNEQNVIPSVEKVEPLIPDLSKRSKVSERSAVSEPVSGWDTPKFASQPAVEQLHSVAEMTTPPAEVSNRRLTTPPAEILQTAETPVTAQTNNVPFQSVTEANAPLRAITELPTADEVSELELNKSNPLYTKDVDAGLEQLLGEWSIFKKSGLFGTGPSGRQHPLYVKLSLLQVPLILAGRFEGSNQEIKQSITDYMNGWRYEQGIIYEANETLDQYLRRVIRHIIDLQKAKRRS